MRNEQAKMEIPRQGCNMSLASRIWRSLQFGFASALAPVHLQTDQQASLRIVMSTLIEFRLSEDMD